MEETKDKLTTIPLSKDTRKRLKIFCTAQDMKYDEAINRLLNVDDLIRKKDKRLKR